MGKTLVQKLRMIADYARCDAQQLDGKPLDGKTVGQTFGNIFAAINGLAEIIEQLIKRNDLD